ncbi:MAG: hypothetical protein LBP28_05215, partial [Coriobacteriales bacterium]|nr:hypothetical protein [Coriobacteriales bacterium]
MTSCDSDKPTDGTLSAAQAYEAAFHHLKGDREGRLSAQQYLDDSTAIYHGAVVRMGYLPKVYGLATLTRFRQIAEQTATLLNRVTQRYLDDAEYRALFGFTDVLEQLIRLPSGYHSLIPIMRVDIFFDERSGDFMFCEFNTDGSSAMNEDREICNALALTPSFALTAKTHALCAQELFDPWVEAFLATWNEWRSGGGSVADDSGVASGSSVANGGPTIAIVDFRESMTINELEEFRARFEAAGCVCLICDIPDLLYTQGKLYASDINPEHPAHRLALPVDAIYRRAVTSEIVADLASAPTTARRALFDVARPQPQRISGSFALCAAVRDEAVCMQGGFRTQVAHSKALFRMLHHPQTLSFLTPTEREFVQRHVPFTANLSAAETDLKAIRRDREQWIIKPIDGYGSVGVFAGRGVSQDEWEALIDAHSDGSYVVQHYC